MGLQPVRSGGWGRSRVAGLAVPAPLGLAPQSPGGEGWLAVPGGD